MRNASIPLVGVVIANQKNVPSCTLSLYRCSPPFAYSSSYLPSNRTCYYLISRTEGPLLRCAPKIGSLPEVPGSRYSFYFIFNQWRPQRWNSFLLLPWPFQGCQGDLSLVKWDRTFSMLNFIVEFSFSPPTVNRVCQNSTSISG